VALCLHLGLIALLSGLRTEGPSRKLRIGSHRDGLVVFGDNRFGLTSIRHFATWTELEAHFAQEQLPLPEVHYAYRNLASDVRLESGHDADGLYYRVLWRTEQGEKVLHTPDLASAQQLSKHIRYQALEPSTFGYAIAIN